MELIATKLRKYGTKHLVAGETFDARPQDASILLRMQFATLPDGEISLPARPVRIKAKPRKPRTRKALPA